MAISPKTPALRVRAALANRMSDQETGFNAYLESICATAGLQAFTINFGDNSSSFVAGKYDVTRLVTDEDLDLPLVSTYQGPSHTDPLGRQVIASTFSGRILFGLDVHLMSSEGQSQNDFDLLVSCVHDAVINTLNDPPEARVQWADQHVVWNKTVAMGQPSRYLTQDTSRYLSTLTFSLTFSIVA